MKKVKPPLRVEVKWTDACNVNGQGMTLETALAKTLAMRCTVGWLLDKNDVRVVLAADYDPATEDDETEYGQLTLIPTGWVTSIHTLTPARPKNDRPKNPSPEKIDLKEGELS